jgi:glutathione S-transferase
MRARLALHASGIEVQHREIELKRKPASMLAASPKGTVPVLILADGTVIDESLDIMQWALQTKDPLHWLPTDTQTQRAALALIAENDGAFKQALDRYKYPARFGLDDGLEWREKGAVFLRKLDTLLLEQANLAGDDWGLCDAALVPFVRQFAHTDPHWFSVQSWSRLARWLQAFERSDPFAVIMQKQPVWVEQSLN